MKRSIILGVIAIALLVLYTTTMSNTFFPLIILLVFVLLNAIIFNEFSRRRHAKDKVGIHATINLDKGIRASSVDKFTQTLHLI